MFIASPSANQRLYSFTPSQILPHDPSSAHIHSRDNSKPLAIAPDTNQRLHIVPDRGNYNSDETRKTKRFNNSHPGRRDYILEDSPIRSSDGLHSVSTGHDMSVSGSESPQPSVFDDGENSQAYGTGADHHTQPTTTRAPSGDEAPMGSYDLQPPPPASALSNVEYLAERVWSADHLKLILRDPTYASRFTHFLNKYKPESSQLLQRYIEIQKAIAAVDYANAVAGSVSRGSAVVANVDGGFEARASGAVEQLVNDALPGYVTHRLVQVVTETLVKEITGQNTPIMRELVNGLAEVYCLTDPSLPDNPIVYASEEFYKTTQYGKDYTIGRNCRFLQGPRTSGATIQRLIDALRQGQEICETVLNYRRDGSPFMNLLMIAPLYDNKGTVRYFIGAQIDVNGLVEGGRGLDSVERLLSQDRAAQRYGGAPGKTPNALLAEMSAMWNREEQDIAQRHSRERSSSDASTQPRGTGRRYLGMDDVQDKDLWPSPLLGPSGRLPGVFQNYLLVRPFPSLRITFTSPALRIPGLLQSKFLDRIGGPVHIRDGILSALSSGIGVTAKVTWLPGGSAPQNAARDYPQQHRGDPLASTHGSQSSRPSSRGQHQAHLQRRPPLHPSGEGKTRWIHCTPLLGSDEKVGVWMIVMVESESITGALNAHERAAEANAAATASMHNSATATPNYQQQSQHQQAPIGPMPLGSPRYGGATSNNPQRFHPVRGRDPEASSGAADHRLYHQYLTDSSSLTREQLASAQHAVAQGKFDGPASDHGSGYPGTNSASAAQRAVSRAASNNRGGKETHEAKAARAKLLAERAMIGEDTFRDF